MQPLSMAASKGDIGLVLMMMESKAQIDALVSEGNRPAHW